MVSKSFILISRHIVLKFFLHKFFPDQHTAAPIAPPVNIVATHVGSTSISLDWDEPLTEYQNGIIREYLVHIIEIDTGNNFSIAVSTKNATINNLHPNYYYDISITAVTVLPGPASPSTVIKTLQGNKVHYCRCICQNETQTI